jgi:hypothetical protein
MTSFALAPMSRAIRAITLAMLAIPLLFAAFAPFVAAALGWIALGVAALYLAVWLAWRPARFEVGTDALRICFPLWTRTLAARSLAGARTLDGAALRRELGFPLRIGVGGLWGAFGWIWSSKRGSIETYISRTDELVWIARRDALPLLLTPERPEEFAACVRSLVR